VTVKVAAWLTTPAVLTQNTIHGPLVAIPSPGTVTVIDAAPQAVVEAPQSSRRRWSLLMLCVEEPKRIIDTIDRVAEEVTVRVPPGAAHDPLAFSTLTLQRQQHSDDTQQLQCSNRIALEEHSCHAPYPHVKPTKT
jgi:hypothetical protein